MSKVKKIPFISFFNWVTEKYIELEKKSLPYPCKLIETIFKNNIPFVVVQISGQSHVIEIDPEKLIEYNLFEYFSTTDKKQIFYLANQKKYLRLSDTYSCNHTNQTIAVFTDTRTEKKISASIETLSMDNSIINQINSKDAYKIGFLSGIEHAKRLFNYIKG